MLTTTTQKMIISSKIESPKTSIWPLILCGVVGEPRDTQLQARMPAHSNRLTVPLLLPFATSMSALDLQFIARVLLSLMCLLL